MNYEKNFCRLVGRTVADGPTEEVGLERGEHRKQSAAAERAVLEVVKHGHEQRVHDRDAEASDHPEQARDVGVGGPAARDVSVVAREAAQVLEEVLDRDGAPVVLKLEVALERLVDVAARERLWGVKHCQPVAHELVEDRVIGGRAERELDGTPVGLVELVLLRVAHQNEVADEVGRGEVLASGVHRLEDELGIVLPLRQRDRYHLEALDASPHDVGVVDTPYEPLEEGEVVE